MTVDIMNFNAYPVSTQQTGKFEFSKNANDYDLDVEISQNPQQPPIHEFITSRSLCTPGCGNTGTNNSFCC